jgi:hypothetical protein
MWYSRRRINNLESMEVSDACPHYMFGRRSPPLCRTISQGILQTSVLEADLSNFSNSLSVPVLRDRTVGVDALRRDPNALGLVAADCR